MSRSTEKADGATESGAPAGIAAEAAILALLGSLLGAYALALFVLGADFDRVREWGYVGIFFIALSGSATIVLPTPASVAIFGSGAVLDPVLGIPAPTSSGS